MQTSDIHSFYEFNSWANARILEAVRALTPEQYTNDLHSSHGGVHGTLVHTMGAEEIWLKRWNGESPSRFYAPEDFPTFAAVSERLSEIDRSLVAFSRSLTTDEALHAVIAYKDLKGNPYSQALWQLMQHLVNHSTYHRGQIVTMLRQHGAKAVATDLVAYYRLQPLPPSS